MMRLIGLVTLLALALAACGGDAAADCDAERLREQAQTGAMSEYAAAMRAFETTTVEKLPEVTANLERIRGAIEAEDWSGCGAEVERHLLASVDANLAALSSLAAGVSETAREHAATGRAEFTAANEALGALE